MMKRLRRTLSFRSRSKYRARNNPQNWENDSINIKHGGLSFSVKYLGAVEVQESRGTQICSQASHQMKVDQTRRKKRVTLWITEDTVRVIEDGTKSLVVDQVIEKVSFCTPDPHDEKLFSYICRDGTTRRWMCHSFRGIRETGERISHAVGCAFAACLQKKQQQNNLNQNFQRGASVRKSKLKERTNANGVVLPDESVQELQKINEKQNEEKMKTVLHSHQNSVASPTKTSPLGQQNPGLANGTQNTQTGNAGNTFIRPRPQPGAEPFTRHMSLRYRNQPLSRAPLTAQSASPGYQALIDDIPAPRLPVANLNIESSSVESATFRTPQPQPFQPVNVTTTAQPGTTSPDHLSNADMWLATAAPSQGLLVTTVNPFSTSATVMSQGIVSNVGVNQMHITRQISEPTANPFADDFERKWSAAGGLSIINAPSLKTEQPNPFGSEFAGRQEQFV